MEACQYAIIEAVANANGVRPENVPYRLQRFVDMDAIGRLAAHENSTWRLTFELPGHSVTVTDDGNVLVDGTVKAGW